MKIGGLELATRLENERPAVERGEPDTLIGTRSFIAPEILLGGSEVASASTQPADLWSLGVTVFFMLTHKYPVPSFARLSEVPQETFKPRLRSALLDLDIVSAECIDFVTGLLAYPPSSRLTAQSAASHSWL